MALITLGLEAIGPNILPSSSPAAETLDALGEFVEFLFFAPRTGTIERIHFQAATVTTDGDGLRQSIQSTTDGPPMLHNAVIGSEVTHVTTTPNAWNRGTAGLGADVTAGVPYFARLAAPAAGTTCNLQIRRTWSQAAFPGHLASVQSHYSVTNTTGSNVAASGMNPIAIEYSDGTVYFIPNFTPFGVMTSTNFNTGSTPDEAGNRIVVPCGCRCIGLYTATIFSADNGTGDIILYDESSNVLRSSSWNENKNRQATQTPAYLPIEPQILVKDQVIRVIDKPTSATNLSRAHFSLDIANGGARLRDAAPWSGYTKFTSRVDGGAFTDIDDQYAANGIIVDQIDIAAAAAEALMGAIVM